MGNDAEETDEVSAWEIMCAHIEELSALCAELRVKCEHSIREAEELIRRSREARERYKQESD